PRRQPMDSSGKVDILKQLIVSLTEAKSKDSASGNALTKSFVSIFSGLQDNEKATPLFGGPGQGVEQEQQIDYHQKRAELSSKIKDAMVSGDNETLAKLQKEWDDVNEQARVAAAKSHRESMARLSTPSGDSVFSKIRLGRHAE